jgi:hypothetical protein
VAVLLFKGLTPLLEKYRSFVFFFIWIFIFERPVARAFRERDEEKDEERGGYLLLFTLLCCVGGRLL